MCYLCYRVTFAKKARFYAGSRGNTFFFLRVTFVNFCVTFRVTLRVTLRRKAKWEIKKNLILERLKTNSDAIFNTNAKIRRNSKPIEVTKTTWTRIYVICSFLTAVLTQENIGRVGVFALAFWQANNNS